MKQYIDIVKVTHEYYKNPSYHQLCKVLNDSPIEKVIPIEWIKERLNKAVAFTHSKAEGNIIDDGCVVSVVSASFTAHVLLNLLEDWEKEKNEDIRG